MPKLICASLLGLGVMLSGCSHAAAPAAAPPPDPLTVDMNAAVNPGADFFAYANGGWLEKNPIPASESSWGIGNEVQDEIYNRLRAISEKAAATAAAAGSDDQKIGDFWTLATDTARADKLGLTPIQAPLDQIAAAKTLGQILAVADALQPIGVGAFYRMGVSQDEKDSAVMTVRLGQGGLGLANRDFYFNAEPGVAKIRQAYLTHLAAVLHSLGEPDAAAKTNSQAVMTFETALAQASRPLAAMRDPYKNYNPMTPEALTAKYSPAVSWRQRLDAQHLPAQTIVVGQPEFFRGLDTALERTPVPVLQEYLCLHLLQAYSPFLGGRFKQEHFHFFNTVMSGQLQPRPLWKQALGSENQALGMVLGRLFVA